MQVIFFNFLFTTFPPNSQGSAQQIQGRFAVSKPQHEPGRL
jgi:hypothetical protein